MGSHGAATAAGQKRVLEHLGIVEEDVGAPIRSSLEVVRVGETEDHLAVYLDKLASEADHIILSWLIASKSTRNLNTNLKNDRKAIEIAIKCVGLIPKDKLKIMRIKNTALLSEVDVSEAYEEELARRSDLEVVIGKRTMGFDADGNLLAFS